MNTHEQAVLCEAAAALNGWLARLPVESEWRATFAAFADEVVSRFNDAAADAERESAAVKERRAVWAGLTTHARERLVLEVIGRAAAPLTITETAGHAADLLCGDQATDGFFSHVRSVVQRLHRAGELDRYSVEPGTPGEHPATRWRFARKVALSGPIADLERAFYV